MKDKRPIKFCPVCGRNCEPTTERVEHQPWRHIMKCEPCNTTYIISKPGEIRA